MNHYTELLSYMKQLAEGDSYVNTITKGENLDLNKANIFPLLNVEINEASFTSDALIQFSIQVQCLAIRDINKEVSTDKFWGQDSNEVDNHNETLATLNRMWRIMHRDFNNNNITASDSPSLTKITFSDKNLLDGWELSFDVEMHNTELNLCAVSKEWN